MSSPSSVISKTYWPYIICAYAALLAFGFLDNIRGPLYPDLVIGLSLTAKQGALFFSMTSFMGFVTSYFTPVLLKRFSVLVVLRISLFLLGLGFLGYGFCTTLTHLLLASFIFGCGFGITSVVQNYAIQVGADPKMRQRLFSGLHANFALASILAPLIANFFIGVPWNIIFMYFSILPFLAFFGTFLAKDIPVSAESKIKKTVSRYTFYHALFVALAFALYLWGELSVATRFVYYLREDLGVEASAANQYLVMFYVGLFIGRIVLTKVQLPLSTISQLIFSFTFAGVSYYLGLTYNPWLISLSGLFMAPCFPLYMEYLSQLFPGYLDKSLAMSMSISSLGVVVMHSVVGWMTDAWGIKTALLIGPLSFLLLIVFIGGHHLLFKGQDLVRWKS